ncbi:MAG: proline--tRNA ligase, partial [bacterium]|nr:proline--tRNA ligase [bacterium]
VRTAVKSWRDLPNNLFQIQTKFRDEIRPRFGLMRGREFIMKDGYSFDVDEGAAKETYQKMHEAYEKIFTRCGLKFRAVEAGTGTIGGSLSHEFQVLADSGEDAILACDHCKYAANVEKAEIRKGPGTKDQGPRTKSKYKKVITPGKKGVEDVAPFLKIKVEQIVKTLIFETDKGAIAGLVRGDHNIKEDKLKILAGLEWCHLAEEKTVNTVTGAPSGYSGPVGLNIPVYVDQELSMMENFCVGANEKDAHLIDVNLGDFKIEKEGDIRAAVEGDGCPRCDKGKLHEHRGIEVGQVFYLGTKYSEAMQAKYLDQNGKEKTMVMGCYGIGIGRTAAAAIEQNHDEKGIVWPAPIAPFQVEVIALNRDQEVMDAAEKIYTDLTQAGVEVLYDDRDERAGVKFADADLIGIPFYVVIGSRGLKDKVVELKTRQSGEIQKIALSDIVQHLSKNCHIVPGTW